MTIERGGLHPDPLDLAPVERDDWSELIGRAHAAGSLDRFAESLRYESLDVREGVIDDLATYYGFDHREVVDRCIRWEAWSVEEWTDQERDSADGLTDFYRTTRSWSFDLLWFAYLQAELHRYPVSAVIAADVGPPEGRRHLDFGCGVGVTGQLFARSGFESEVADIATGMLDFARFRLERRGDHVRRIDLNDERLESDRYDVVTAIDTLVHIPDLERVLRDLHAAIRPGGLLFANVAARPRTLENAQFLYEDELPVRRLIQRCGFEPLGQLDGMVTKYRRVETTGIAHLARRARDAVVLSPLRPIVRGWRDRLRS
ncbi:MAG: class I SAM-dependent methyltransferase [Ilumatobacter sp.]|nr:class I SAM-dependent methyltransferase [Ilumatobacter sp.]